MTLEIVGDDDLSETLKFNEMATKLNRFCVEELGTLDQRIGVLLGDASVQVENSPFGTSAICGAYKYACRQATPHIAVRMVLLQLFDDHVLDDIRSIYKALNEFLVDNEILPKIRFAVARRENDKESSTAEAAASRPLIEGDFFAVLQKLMAHGGGFGGGSSSSSSGGGGGPVLQGADLFASLTRIQVGDLSGVTGAEALRGGSIGAGTANVLHELKASSIGVAMVQMDATTLD